MPAHGITHDVLGVTVGAVEPARRLLHLALDENVIALYGLNGSGKTRILNLIEMALAGVRPEQDLLEDERQESILDVHIQVPDVERLHGFHAGEFGSMIHRKIREAQVKLGLVVDEGAGPHNLEEPLVRLARLVCQVDRQNLFHASSHEDADLWEAALVEGASRGRLTLRATGSRGWGRWDVYFAISPEDEFGALALSSPGLQGAVSLDVQPYWRVVGARPHNDRGLGALQVPACGVGAIVAQEAFDLELKNDGRRRVVREDRAGFLLAHVIGPTVDSDADRATLGVLQSWTGTFDDGLLDEAGQLEPWIREQTAALERLAAEIFHAVCPTPEELVFTFGTPEDWMRGNPPAWFGNGVHVSSLSGAQARWSRIAIAVANARMSLLPHDDLTSVEQIRAPLVALLDEPERGLHRLLEHRLGQALNHLARASGGTCIVATHSPDLVASSHVRPMQVIWDNKTGTRIRPVQVSVADGIAMESSADSLGLSVGDLWALARLTVVVEGIHDEWVFKNLIGDTIDSALAGIFAIHGATRLRSLAEARVIMRGTDSPVLIVLDDLDASRANALLADVKAARLSDDSSSLGSALEALRATKGDSYLFLHQFVHAALEVGNLDRVHIHGLSLPDVICYLPAERLLRADVEWGELLEQWRSEAGPAGASNLKKWLRGRRLLPQNAEEIDALIEVVSGEVRRMNFPIHHDLVQLGMRIVELANGRGQQPG